MANRGQISWVEFESPLAAATTFSKSGGIKAAFSSSDFSWDAFQREVIAGFGSANQGGGYTLVGTAADFSVSNGTGKIVSPAHTAYVAKLLDVSLKDIERGGRVRTSLVPVGSTLAVGPILRGVDDNNYYRPTIRFLTSGDVETEISKLVGGAAISIVANATRLTAVPANTWLRWHAKIQGTTLYFSVWLDTDPEPAWQAVGTDAGNTFPNAGFVGFRANFGSLTNNPTLEIDDHLTFVGSMGGGQKVTYIAKSGGIQSAASFGGTKVKQVARSGGTVSSGSLGGLRTITHSKSAGPLGPVSIGGSKAASFAKSGGTFTQGIFSGVVSTPVKLRVSWVEFEIPAVASTDQSKTGGIRSSGSVGGIPFNANIFLKTGGFTSTGRFGSTKLSNLWDDWSVARTFTVIAIPAKIGGITVPGSLGGSKAVQASKTIGIVSPGSVGGSKMVAIPKSGGFASAGRLGANVNSNFTFVRLGGMSSAGSLGASRSLFHGKEGGMSSEGATGASKAYSAAKTGGIVSVGRFAGDKLISSAFAKSGGLSTAWQSSGTKIASYAKAGGTSGSVSTGSGEIRRAGGMSSAASMGAARVIKHVKLSGIALSTSIGADKFVTFTKAAAGISSTGSLGGIQAQPYDKSGGIISIGSFGGSQHVPMRQFPMVGGFVSTATLGATKLKLVRRAAGIVSVGRLGDDRRIGIISVGHLGGTVSIKLHIKSNPRHQIISVEIDETQLLEVGIS